jgi:hypothetical protein
MIVSLTPKHTPSSTQTSRILYDDAKPADHLIWGLLIVPNHYNPDHHHTAQSWTCKLLLLNQQTHTIPIMTVLKLSNP